MFVMMTVMCVIFTAQRGCFISTCTRSPFRLLVQREVEPPPASAVIGGQEMGVWTSVSDLRKGFESVGGGGFSKSL